MTKTHQYLLAIISAVMFFSALSMGAEDELQQDRVYCQRVSDGIWPNYNNVDCSWYEDEIK